MRRANRGRDLSKPGQNSIRRTYAVVKTLKMGKAKTGKRQDLAATTGGTTEAGSSRGGGAEGNHGERDKRVDGRRLQVTLTCWKHDRLLEAT